ncbi:MAG: cupin domain-containing protein [Verrucomicrobiae bacterium]|nr:cupin domain-containing protein [Verrucomicrobiae bacterium]
MKAFVIQLDELPAQPCPCGSAQRGFGDLPGAVASMHLVRICGEATTHHHARTTELYYILEGSGFVELDGERIRVRPGTAIYIPPGVRHRAIGDLRLINVPVPAFDPRDEHLD